MKIQTLLASLLMFAQPALAKWDHIFVIVMENAGYSAIIGNPTDAPYINKTLLPQAALYTQSLGVTHPSLPNYLALFSGAIQENPANTSDHCLDNNNGPFNAPNLYHSLTAVGQSVSGFFESMDPRDPLSCGTGKPSAGGAYVQKHNPFPYFTSGGSYNVPITAWQPYTGPIRTSWPGLSFIVPNIPNDMHVYNVSPGVLATLSQRVKKGDTWLGNNLPTLISYCRSNNGLIILTMDEAEAVDEQHIPTILVGANVAGGQIVTQVINHYNVTKTITDNFGVPAIGHSVGLLPLNPTLLASLPNLSNISTRASVGTGENLLIGGFIITGSGTKSVLLRALGPTLTKFGITNAMANPALELHNSAGALIASNDNWVSAANAQSIPVNFRPPNSTESAILTSLAPGRYTTILRGVNNTSGVALVEAYDLSGAAVSELTNISTRGLVQTGNGAMIGGFIVQGTSVERVLVRALGPTLANFGIANPLSNPTLELRDGNGNLVDSNDNWQSSNQAAITATGLQPPNAFEPAILGSLAPGNYTALVRGVNNATGIALMEVYDLL